MTDLFERSLSFTANSIVLVYQLSYSGETVANTICYIKHTSSHYDPYSWCPAILQWEVEHVTPKWVCRLLVHRKKSQKLWHSHRMHHGWTEGFDQASCASWDFPLWYWWNTNGKMIVFSETKSPWVLKKSYKIRNNWTQNQRWRDEGAHWI